MRRLRVVLLSGAVSLVGIVVATAGGQQVAGLPGEVVITGPAGSACFGESVVPMPNGRIVVSDPCYSPGGVSEVGAVYLLSGTDMTVLATVVGSTAGDRVGSVVTLLANGNLVVGSGSWDNGPIVDAGAVTWVPAGATGTIVVGAGNSVVGSSQGDGVGRVTPLVDGDFVIRAASYAGGGAGAGAVRWVDGDVGATGPLTAANSLVGTPGDQVGVDGVDALANGNYVVRSSSWDDGTTSLAGAVTWGDGAAGSVGVVSAANSVVGSTSNDLVGSTPIVELANGHLVVRSPSWDLGASANRGAVTWMSGTAPTVGPMSAANSLIGGTAGDSVGGDVVGLTNGNYVVTTYNWQRPGVGAAGATTWASGAGPTSAVVSEANSLVGSTVGDQLGSMGVVPLTNGNYVVASPDWDNGAVVNAGAYTWGDGATGTVGVVSAANSLVGSTAGDGGVGVAERGSVVALTGGNYVVRVPRWDAGASVDAGAAAWGNGVTGTNGVISAANALVGAQQQDKTGLRVVALANGNYVVHSSFVAATWANGASGVTGVVSSANSLVAPGLSGIVALSDGDFVVICGLCTVGAAVQVGAVSWVDGTVGRVGSLSATDSVVGVQAGDHSETFVQALAGGAFVVSAPTHDVDGLVDAGAARWFDGVGPFTGSMTATNSAVGSTANARFNGVVYEIGGAIAMIHNSVNGLTSQFAWRVESSGSAFVGPATSTNSVFVPGGTARTPLRVGGLTIYNASGFNRLVVTGLPVPPTTTTTTLPPPTTTSPPPPPPPAGGGIEPLVPVRLADSRSGTDGTIDGAFEATGRLAPGVPWRVQIAGRASVATGTRAAILNVIAIGPATAGFATVYPCTSTVPSASNLNFGVGAVVANAALAGLDAAGGVCVVASTAVDVVIDVTGAVPAGSPLTGIGPVRLLETRVGAASTVDGDAWQSGLVPAGGTVELPVAGRGGVPPGASAVVLNVTVTQPEGPGFVTVFPCGSGRPTASSVNVVAAGQTVPNAVFARIGAGGRVCLYASTAMHLIADANAYQIGPVPLTGVGPVRLLETRVGAASTVDGVAWQSGLVPAGGTVELPVAGRGGVPPGASAVVLNVTVTQPEGPGFVTVFPCGSDRPTASSVNVVAAGQTVPNAVFARIGAGGRVCLYASTAMHLIADANAFVAA